MNKGTESFFGLWGLAVIGVAIWLGFVEGFAPAMVFFLIGAMFLGLVVGFVEKSGQILDKVFRSKADDF